jgi:tyrosine-protein kinase Etk/Wzc
MKKLLPVNEDFDLSLFLYIAKKNLIWIFFFFVISIALGLLFLRYSSEVFESSSVLQINNKNTAQDILNVDEENKNLEEIASEIELLRSKVFLKRALSKLPLGISYFARGTFKTNEHYTASSYKVETFVKDKSAYGVPFSVNFLNAYEYELSYPGSKPEQQKFKVAEWVDLPSVRFKLILLDQGHIVSELNNMNKDQLFFVINNPDKIAETYYNDLTISLLSEAAKTIKITCKGYNSKKTADIVNMLSNEFIVYDLEKKAESSNKVLEFIDQQLSIVYNDLKTSEGKIQSFKKENKLGSDIDNFTESYIEKLNSLENEIISLDLEKSILTDIETGISKSENIDIYKLLPMLAGTKYEGTISSIVTSLQRLLLEKEKALYEAKPNNEAIKNIDYQIGIQKRLLLESIKSLKGKIESKENSLNSKIASFESKFFNLPTKEVEYARLQRLFTINEKFYTLLLEKKAEYSISNAGFVSGNIVLEEADTPSSPIFPKKNMILVVSVVIAVVFSLFLVFIKYWMHNNVTSINDIKKYTSAVVLGIIPKFKREIPVSQLLVDENPKAAIAEAFRSIRTNLQFISNESGPKILAVTSSISGEGKTFVAINLGGIIAFADKKCIILDLDMRKPKIHIGFNAANEKGMSTILISKDSVESCIQKSTLKNLDYITAGPIPPNPSELIISKKMDEVLDQLKKMYDLIIIDNPPVGLVSDGIANLKRADYPVYVFRANYSKKYFFEGVNNIILENKVKNLSIILNGVDEINPGYGYYGNGYGYGYYDEDSHAKKKSFFRNIASKIKLT